MPALRPSTWVILGLLALLAWNIRTALIPAATLAVPWILGQPAALLLLLLGALYFRATHPTNQARNHR